MNIGIFSQDERLDELIVQLKKRNYNASKLKVDGNFNDVDVLIIDLAFPMELAFTILEKINTNYLYSEMSILAAISRRNELLKLRILGLKVHGYISLEIEAEDLITKIEETKNPEMLPVKKFKGETLEAEIEGNLTNISESGALVSGSVCMVRGKELVLRSSLFDDLKIDHKIICKVLKSYPAPGRKFISEIDFINLSDSDRDNIRKMILGWSLK